MKPLSARRKTEVLRGERIGRQGEVRLGCSAILFDSERNLVLLTRREDNGLWCLPGGTVDPGESVAEACEREMQEETGLKVRLVRLVGIYSDPNKLVIYPDGNKVHVVVLSFEVEQIGGRLHLNDESSEGRFLPVAEAANMELFHDHAQHIRDALAGQHETFIR